MTKRWLLGLVLAAVLAVAAVVIWWPGCGFVDVWVVLTDACEAAGGGGSGAS